MKLLALISLLITSSAHAVIGGRPVIPTDPVARSTVAVNIIFSGFPGQTPPEGPVPISPCTATILAEDIVVLAAHCVKDFHHFQIMFGLNLLNAKIETRDVIASDTPLTYRDGYAEDPVPTNNSDIALLYFKGGLPPGYRPALLLPAIPLKNETPVWIAGYGFCDTLCLLTQVQTQILNDQYAATEFALVSTPQAGSTKGDSGGPAFILNHDQAYIFGVCNWGDRRVLHIDVYANIQSHAAWILDSIDRLRKTGVSRGPVRHQSTTSSSGPVVTLPAPTIPSP
jgi:hypothetical protein